MKLKKKQKESEGSKAGDFDSSKGWFDHFRESFGLKNIKTGEEASANREVVDQFPNAIKKIIEEKGFLPEQETSFGEKKNAQETFTTKEEK